MGWIGGDQPTPEAPASGGDETDELLARVRRLDPSCRGDEPPFAVLLAVVHDFDARCQQVGRAVAVRLVDEVVARLRESWFGWIYRCGDDRFATIVRTGRREPDFDGAVQRRADELHDAACAVVARHADAIAALDVRVVVSPSRADGLRYDADMIWCRAQLLAARSDPERARADPAPAEPEHVVVTVDPIELPSEAELIAHLGHLDEVVAPPQPPYALVFVGPAGEHAGAGPTTQAIVDAALGDAWPQYGVGFDDVVVVVPSGAPATPGEVARRISMTAGQHPDSWVGDPHRLVVLYAAAWDTCGLHRRRGIELWRELRQHALLERLRTAEERVWSLAAELEALTGIHDPLPSPVPRERPEGATLLPSARRAS